MVNRPRAIGTSAETAVTRTARTRGFPWAERVALHGRADVGDVHLCPGVVVEVKGGQAARTASDAQLEVWLTQTETERRNAGAAVGLLVLQRAGVGPGNAHRWPTYLRLPALEAMRDQTTTLALEHVVIRLSLEDALLMLRAAGYGTPLPAPDRSTHPEGQPA